MVNKFKASIKNNISGFYPTAEKVELLNNETSKFDYSISVLVTNIPEDTDVFNIMVNCEFPGMFFRDTLFFGRHVVIAVENYIYFFDLITKEQAQYKLCGYFDKFILHENNLLACTNTHLSCYAEDTAKNWVSDKLAVEKIVVKNITDSYIQGTGNWDDKNGLVPFSVSIKNGRQQTGRPKEKRRNRISGFIASLKI